MSRATIVEWLPGTGGAQGKALGEPLKVDFDPQSLLLTYSSYGGGGDQTPNKEDRVQNTTAQGTGDTTTLGMTLLFDSSRTNESVQSRTDHLVQLARLKPETKPATLPIVCFQWGHFMFVGRIQSMNQTLDFFSAEGVPLRATVVLTLQWVAPPDPNAGRPPPNPSATFGAGAGIGAGASFGASAGASFGAGASFSASASVGTTPLTLSQSGDSVQAIAARAGVAVSWKAVAAANGIDNPRLIPPGTVLNLRARASAEASVR